MALNRMESGLTVIYDGIKQSSRISGIDVIAVHGLNPTGSPEHARKTWEAGNHLWLKDFLPASLLPRECRVMLFAYNASPAINTSSINLDDHAKLLLQFLRIKRRESAQRPIIFICHSLGGLVVKSALVEATLDTSYQPILHATRLLVFFATPHQGGNNASMGDIAATILRTALRTPSNDLLEALKKASNEATRRFEQARHLPERCLVISIYEGKAYNKLGIIVDKKSATLNLPGSREIQIGLDADHSSICKIGSAESATGELILGTIAMELERSLEEAEATTNRGRFRLPPPRLAQMVSSHQFIGRHSELQSMDTLLADTTDTRPVVLHGLAGIGKTQLTSAFIRKNSESYYPIFWLNARDVLSLQFSITAAVKRIKQHSEEWPYINSAAVAAAPEMGVAAFMRWLDEPGNSYWLLVFDNYDDPKSLRNDNQRAETSGQNDNNQPLDIRDYFPETTLGKIIVITICANLYIGKLMNLDKFHDISMSLELLAETSGRTQLEDDAAALKLAGILDGYPLALATAGTYLHQVNTSWAQYLSMYEGSWLQLQKNSPQLMSYECCMFTAWNLSFEHLQRKNPQSAMLLRQWAYFDKDDIWFELLKAAADSAPQSLDQVKSRIGFDSVIRVICNYGLAKAHAWEDDLSSSSPGYSIHRCVHDWVANALNGSIDERMSRYAIRCISGVLLEGGGDLRTLAETVRHKRLIRHAEVAVTKLDGVRINGNDWLHLHNVATLLHTQGHLDKAERLFHQVLLGKLNVFGRAMTTCETINSIGNLLRDKGNLVEAERMFRRAYEGFSDLRGRTDKLTLDALTNLGNVLISLERLEEAESALQVAYIELRDSLGQDDASTLSVLVALANLHLNKGDFNQGTTMLEETLKQARQKLGPQHQITHSILQSLGSAYANQGQLDKAEARYSEVMDTFQLTVGQDHRLTLESMVNLGHIYFDRGRIEEAEKILNTAIAGLEQISGGKTIIILKAVQTLGILYASTDRLPEAESMFRRVLLGREAIYGPEHSQTLEPVVNLGTVCAAQGQTNEAEQLYERAAQGFAKLELLNR